MRTETYAELSQADVRGRLASLDSMTEGDHPVLADAVAYIGLLEMLVEAWRDLATQGRASVQVTQV